MGPYKFALMLDVFVPGLFQLIELYAVVVYPLLFRLMPHEELNRDVFIFSDARLLAGLGKQMLLELMLSLPCVPEIKH